MEKSLDKVGKKMGKVLTGEGEEGRFTKAIEHQTEKIPSGVFLTAGVSAIAASLAFKACGMSKTANFIGLWTPTILVLGLYNKLVKLEGHERDSESSMH